MLPELGGGGGAEGGRKPGSNSGKDERDSSGENADFVLNVEVCERLLFKTFDKAHPQHVRQASVFRLVNTCTSPNCADAL